MGYDFCFTKDGSVGLYDNDVNDIYHSSLGAYQEAIDKFVVPSQIERFKDKKCRVLDICYGIGYNTKALLKYSLENNLNIEFEIDALEINNTLIQLSPFIKNDINEFYEIDSFILNSYINENNFEIDKIFRIINQNKKFLTKDKPYFDKIIQNRGYKYNALDKIKAFLHNIYYHNMTKRLKIGQKTSIFGKSALKWHINDARKVVSTLSEKYDIIFLDAFTAKKQPLLWTYEFLSKLTDLLEKENGVLVSYSSSAPFRNSLLNLGINIGKHYSNDCNIISTISSYNKNLIKYEIDDFEFGLLSTKAGIPYRDKMLNASVDEILSIRNDEMNNSNLESANSYYKRNNRRYGRH